MKPILLKPEHNITDFSSTDKTRYVLQSVHYNKEKQLLEATDGRIAIRVPVMVDEQENFPPIENAVDVQDVIIPSDKFDKVMKTMPKGFKLDILNSVALTATDKNKIVLTTNDLDTQNDAKVKEIEGEYPNMGFYFEKPLEQHKLKVSIAVNVLQKIADYAAKHSVNKVVKDVTFYFDDSLDPVRFTIDISSGQANGVFMPVRKE